MAAMIRLLPAGFTTSPYRSTDGTVFVVVEGEGEIHIGDKSGDATHTTGLPLTPHDVVVVPGWMAHTLHATKDLVLFSYFDRVAQEKLGFFREQRL